MLVEISGDEPCPALKGARLISVDCYGCIAASSCGIISVGDENESTKSTNCRR